MSRAAVAIEALRKRNPHAVQLAQTVSFAVVIDRALLRAARLQLVPEADAGTEADLWFSSIVKSRTVDGIVLDRDVVEFLRGAMKPEAVEAAWRVTAREHEPWLAPSLQFEEEVAYLSVSTRPGSRERMAARIQSVVRAMLRQDRPGLAQWAARALAMFPTDVRDLPETKMLDAGARIRLGRGLAVAEDEPLPEWMPLVAPPSMERAELQVELRERELVLTAAPGPRKILVPATNPIVVEVSWDKEAKQVVLRTGETVRLAVGSDAVRIRTIAGEEFNISETATTSAALTSEVIDFSTELERHTRVVGRERELAELLSRSGMVRMGGEEGVGKTALLCELIRRLAPAPVFVHFFRSGDYRLGSISAAMRSIAAQIALRYRLDENVVDLPLGRVLERLALSPRSPERLFIVLDDVDDARDEFRSVVDDPLAVMFGTLPEFVTVFASALDGVTTEKLRRLRAEQKSLYAELRQAVLDDHEKASFLSKREVELSREIDRVDAEAGAFRVRPSEEAVQERYSDRFVTDRSDGNFGQAEAVNAGGTLGINVPVDAILHALREEQAAAVAALSVARAPLPPILFRNAVGALMRFEKNQYVELLKGVARLIRGTDEDAVARHGALLQILETNLHLEDVCRYYALHAIEHVLATRRPEVALALCRQPAFIKEVIRHYDSALMAAHYRRLGLDYADRWVRGAELAFAREADAIAEAPDELDAIFRTYLRPEARRQETRLVVTRDIGSFGRLPPRRHDAPVTGCAVVGDGTIASWSSDGRLLLWHDRETLEVVDHGTAIPAVIQVHEFLVIGDAAGFLHAARPKGRFTSTVAAHAGAVTGAVASTGRLFATARSAPGTSPSGAPCR